MKKFLKKYDGEIICASAIAGVLIVVAGACIASNYLVAAGFAVTWLMPMFVTLWSIEQD